MLICLREQAHICVPSIWGRIDGGLRVVLVSFLQDRRLKGRYDVKEKCGKQ
jgi:hypothetical protein